MVRCNLHACLLVKTSLSFFPQQRQKGLPAPGKKQEDASTECNSDYQFRKVNLTS